MVPQESYKQRFPFDDHFIGIEIEVEGVGKLNPEVWNSRFLFHKEGSLREGQELVTRLGHTAGECLESVRLFNNEVKNREFSFRCGLHIHIDVTRHTFEEIYKAVLVYSVLEELLFDISGSRNTGPNPNRFCVAVQDAKSCFTDIIHYGQQRYWEGVADAVAKGTKYMAFNVLPCTRFGSVEFRHHYGTCDPVVILNWLQVLLDIVVGSKRLNLEELETQILTVNTVSFYEDLLQELLPNSHGRIPRKDFEKKMYRGVAFVKEAFLGEFA